MWCLLIWNEMVKWDRAEKVSKAVGGHIEVWEAGNLVGGCMDGGPARWKRWRIWTHGGQSWHG